MSTQEQEKSDFLAQCQIVIADMPKPSKKANPREQALLEEISELRSFLSDCFLEVSDLASLAESLAKATRLDNECGLAPNLALVELVHERINRLSEKIGEAV
jgi:hypothetical protein